MIRHAIASRYSGKAMPLAELCGTQAEDAMPLCWDCTLSATHLYRAHIKTHSAGEVGDSEISVVGGMMRSQKGVNIMYGICCTWPLTSLSV